MIVPVNEDHLVRAAPAALLRLGYLFPEIRFRLRGRDIEITGEIADENKVQREVCYALYRQHVLLATLPLREALLHTLGQR